jgi:hypothetical protein
LISELIIPCGLKILPLITWKKVILEIFALLGPVVAQYTEPAHTLLEYDLEVIGKKNHDVDGNKVENRGNKSYIKKESPTPKRGAFGWGCFGQASFL